MAQLNAADEKQVKDAREREKREREIELADVRLVMSSKEGRRYVNRLVEFCGVLRSSFHNSGSITSFNEGQRNVGLRVYADLEAACPDLYLLMRQEAKKEQENA